VTGAPKRRRLLIVDDDEELLSSYRRFFGEVHREEFLASYASDGEQALAVLRHQPVDVLVLDWSLPGISGASLAKALRATARTRALGILMVTARSASAETVFALDSGADDLLAKPFEWNVLLARLRSLARRGELTLERHLELEFPGLRLDLDAERLTLDGRAVALTRKEFGLLKVFLSRPGVLHSTAYLWETVWGYESDGWERTLRVTLSTLRGKLGARWGAALKAQPGRGYVFEPVV
jgi:DNA-binding response OmpR family regulator